MTNAKISEMNDVNNVEVLSAKANGVQHVEVGDIYSSQIKGVHQVEVVEIDSTKVNGAQNATEPATHAKWVPILEQPIRSPRKLRVVCIGAGYAGLMMAYKIKYQMKMADVIDLCIYEKNADVGGTWLENRYPGVAWSVSLSNMILSVC